ncbi:potassium transporter Kup [Coralloluteibacterium stylophorae]|uniref:Probable potassium transport system protein Kup n=1 Tax=Coralloluteibacterium stylophorae TaxID=1776034 RepID=A0A8J7VUA3_9GAMM|nr:potassium transporter Kup [Coralloluteibacterium stylophorae]MBS7456778.1 potassium transporter Kup [Coralloluteibacterium stylophorae]
MSHQPQAQTPAELRTLVLGAIGVVFGDIGTSPLYALKDAFSPHYGLTPDHPTVLGILSMIFWSLILVVSVKYLMIIMRADNKGEGGIMALMALAQRALKPGSRQRYLVGLLGVFGAALFFGDSVLTPAVSVLSAIEGLEVAAPTLHNLIVPLAIVVLLGLFMFQKHGTERVGRVFGPVTALWFLCLAIIGIWHIARTPEVLAALNPYWAYYFFAHHEASGFLILGAVVLVVTGGEALYADMGHFGRRPIRLAWFGFVLPALVLNYFGQGALVFSNPAAVQNPFYHAVPGWALYPMIGLATAATVVASQAVISGAFSVSRQAMQLGYIPRLVVRHTSESEEGQIYVPAINRMLLVLVIALVLAFRSSEGLTAAYGVSVTGTMLIDVLLLMVVAYNVWTKARRWVLPVAVVLLLVDLAFFASNATKFFDGAWVPVMISVAAFIAMRSWRRGKLLVSENLNAQQINREVFLQALAIAPPHRVDGTAVFLSAGSPGVPAALMHNLKHNKVLHERNILLTVKTLDEPYAEPGERAELRELSCGFKEVTLRYGFAEEPDVPRALARGAVPGLAFDLMETTFFSSRETVVAAPQVGMALWRDKLFAFMARNASPATDFFRIPGNRLVELGTQVTI